MCSSQDARPFTDLRKDAKEFREKFDEDINECTSFLDKKITALICDPDSLGHSTSVKQNALSEFSKAKYDIFMSVKSMVNKKEKEWLNYISEMKKLFIENVEIFLAGTKLEVKLPSSEFQPSLGGHKKSPGNQKGNTTSATRSIYPLLTTLTKNIPVLGSPLRKSDISNTESEERNNVEDNVQFNRRSRLAVSIPKLSESQIGGYAEFSTRGRLSTPSIKLAECQRNSDSSDSSESEAKTENETMEIETEFDVIASQLGSRHRNSSNKERNQDMNTSQPGSRQRSSSNKEIDLVADAPQVQGRRNKKVLLNSKVVNGISQKHSSDDNQIDILNHIQSSSTSSDENDVEKAKANPVPLKGRRGRSTAQNKKADSSDTLLTNDKKTIRGKQISTDITDTYTQIAAVQSKSTSSDENDALEAPVPVPIKGRRGRLTKNKMADSSVLPPASQISEDSDIVNGEESIEDISNKSRRGRAASSSKNAKTVTDNIAVSKMTRGRRGIKIMVENKKHESVPSYEKSDIPCNDDSEPDVETPVVRPTKSAVRRKTLLPNLETITGADIIPGVAARSRSKRKTISGSSELETIAPTKRLKVGIQKIASSQEENSDANDNLLESDDSYSEWMSLKRVDGKTPTCPAVYEVKVSRAKKPAYIGSCDSLRQKLTLYKLKQSSGHKHLDKFIERNYDDIQVRYEIIPSLGNAEKEVKNRIKSFVGQYKTTPAYN